jgi:hypothetical protein
MNEVEVALRCLTIPSLSSAGREISDAMVPRLLREGELRRGGTVI